jgi:hypothetical protein
MKRGRIGRSLALGLFAACVTVLNTGCIDRIAQNMLVGFGFSLGALPADVVSSFVLDSFLGGTDGDFSTPE